MSNLSYPSIPEPGNTLEGLAESVRVLKQAMILVTGQSKSNSFGAPRMFIQGTTPAAEHKGDLWVNTVTNKLVYCDGTTWIVLS